MSCDNEIQKKEENIVSEDDSEIVDLMNRVEHMKRERSVLWLREFKEWMDHASENYVDDSIYGRAKLHPEQEDCVKNKKSQRHVAESSIYVQGSVQASKDQSSMNVLESDDCLADMPTGWKSFHCFDCVGSLGITGGVCLPGMGRMNMRQEHQKQHYHEKVGNASVQARCSYSETCNRVEKANESPQNSTDVSNAHLSSTSPGSPPHYKEDILHRRHNLVEEILQLSAESYSVASSDSDTTCSDDDCSINEHWMPEVDQSLNYEYGYRTVDEHSLSDIIEDNGNNQKCDGTCERKDGRSIDILTGAHDGDCGHSVNQGGSVLLEKKKKRKQRRVISLSKENMDGETETSHKLNGYSGNNGADIRIGQGNQCFDRTDLQNDIDMKRTQENSVTTHSIYGCGIFSVAKCSSLMREDFIENYFNKNLADSGSHETFRQCTFCCMLEQESTCRER